MSGSEEGEIRASLLLIKGLISEMSAEDQKKVSDIKDRLTEVFQADGEDGNAGYLALGVVSLEETIRRSNRRRV